MPIVAKVSLATALPTVRGLVGDLGRTARDLGPLPGLEPVLNGVASLDGWCARKPLDVDVVVVSPLEVDTAGNVGAWIGRGFPVAVLARVGQTASADLPSSEGLAPLRVRATPLASAGAAPAGTARAPVLVAVIGNASALQPETMVALDGLFDDRPRVVVVGSPLASTVKLVEARAQDLAWTASLVDPEAMPSVPLQRALATPPWDGMHELFRAHAAAGALETLTEVFDLVMEQQFRDIKVKRSVAQAKLGKPAGPAGRPALVTGTGTNEILAEVKIRVQRHAQEFERGASERLADLLSPTSGALYRETEALLYSLERLSEDPRSTKIETRLPTDFLEHLIRLVREHIARHCSADVVAVNDLFRLLSQEIERTLQTNDGPPFVAHFAYLTEERVRRVLDMSAVLQVQYRGEMPRRGFGEYFASVRKYSMLLVMAASMFGLSQFMRQYREYMIPATILLVLFGSYSVARSTQEQRVESLEKELEAARNALRPDLKRIFTEVQKSWMAVLSSHLSEQIGTVLNLVDEAIREHLARKGAEASPEKERMQRQIAQLDLLEKKLALPQKARDALVATVGQIKGELRGLMPRPGAPGALALKPALPGAGAAAAGGAAATAAAAAQAKLAAMRAAGSAPGGAPSATAPTKASVAKPAAEAVSAAAPPPKPANPFAEKLAAMKAKRDGGVSGPSPAPSGTPASPEATPADGSVAGESALPAQAKAANPFAEKLAAMKAKRDGGVSAPPPVGTASSPGVASADGSVASEPAPPAQPKAPSAIAEKLAALKAKKAGAALALAANVPEPSPIVAPSSAPSTAATPNDPAVAPDPPPVVAALQVPTPAREPSAQAGAPDPSPVIAAAPVEPPTPEDLPPPEKA